MSGSIYQFGTVTLPGAAAKWNVSTPAQKSLVKTLGGPFDPERSNRSPLDLPYNVTVSALALAASRSALGATLDDYRGMLGWRDRLWLKPHDTTQVDRWCWARLVDVNETGSVYNRIWQPVDLVFQNISGWNGHAYGGAWNLDAGYYFDNGLYLDSGTYYTLETGIGAAPPYYGTGADVTLTNAGNRPVTNLGISFAAQVNTGFVNITIASLAQLSYVGTIAQNSVLTIDCGSHTVLLDGAPAYGNFTIGPNQYTADWLPLAPGNTVVNVQTDFDFPAMPHVSFVYSDGWV
jgi:hypothetical protein